mmetsp:Transcript_148/g.438  ORF Transcript_148/g.438 Transcript_148/m.438 type:complete len:232 (-) Transcript_148:207-902(-)
MRTVFKPSTLRMLPQEHNFVPHLRPLSCRPPLLSVCQARQALRSLRLRLLLRLLRLLRLRPPRTPARALPFRLCKHQRNLPQHLRLPREISPRTPHVTRRWYSSIIPLLGIRPYSSNCISVCLCLQSRFHRLRMPPISPRPKFSLATRASRLTLSRYPRRCALAPWLRAQLLAQLVDQRQIVLLCCHLLRQLGQLPQFCHLPQLCHPPHLRTPDPLPYELHILLSLQSAMV